MRQHGLRAERRQNLVEEAIGNGITLDTYEPDELLSMGQSALVYSVGYDCDRSIFLSTPERGSPQEPVRYLALYDVAHNKLGLPAEWPVPDPNLTPIPLLFRPGKPWELP